MATLKDSYHFVTATDLLRINGQTHFQEVYKQLNDAGQGGFLLIDEGKAQTYVNAYNLADTVVRRAVKEVERNYSIPHSQLNHRLKDSTDPSTTMLANLMQAISQTPIREIVQDIRNWIFIEIDETAVDVDAEETALQNQDDKVFEVYESGQPVGWYLNHERVRDTTTEKPVFICSNGHPNPDTDSGRCYRCNGTFISTTTISSVRGVTP